MSLRKYCVKTQLESENNKKHNRELKSKTNQELVEILERQKQILNNRVFLQKLPDKGEKVKVFFEKVQNEYEERQKFGDATAQLFSNLSLNDGRNEEIEWNNNKITENKEEFDSDDEFHISDTEMNPVKLIANHSGTIKGKKKISNFYKNTYSSLNLSYVNKMCLKYDEVTQTKSKFKPNKLKENNDIIISRSAENVKKCLGEKWEVTQVTPPIFSLKNTLPITLSESIELQKKQAKVLKEIQKKYAADKLLQNSKKKVEEKLLYACTDNYRDVKNYSCDSSEDEPNDDQIFIVKY